MEAFAQYVAWHWEWLSKLREFGAPHWKVREVEEQCRLFQLALDVIRAQGT